MKYYIIFFLCFTTQLFGTVHTSYLWHLQQPVYWPEQSQWNPYHYQTVWESHYLKMSGGNVYDDGLAHPLNDLESIFGNADRVAVYQYRARDAVQSLLGLSKAGAQVNYSGCLMQNVNSLADAGQWGYYQNWQQSFIEARNWTTSGGKPRMDLTGFTMHHALSPLIDENALRKQIQAHRYIYLEHFGAPYSKGYWPAECSFSERIIQVLVEEGFEWTIIANSKLARTLNDYPLHFGTNGCNTVPPNPADKVPTNGNNWWNGQIDGRGGTFAAPYSYQAHKAQYVAPETGEVFKITVVPMADMLSYMNGYGTMDTGIIDNHIAPYNNPQKPSIVLMAHDGDNAWGGGFSYYNDSVPDFAYAAHNQGYVPTTIEQFLADFPVADDDVVKVEDGSWFNAANDWGHPQFINWLWPMYTGSFQFDPHGWTADARNWAVLTAAQNRVETAENLIGEPVLTEHIVSPNANSNYAERAWHHLLPGYTSGYMYYGVSIDMEVKPSLAANLATDFADLVIENHNGNDMTAPTIFIPQRYPYNPGGIGFGPEYGYQVHHHSTDFTVWTFVYDAGGVHSVTLKYRLDEDGVNPLDDYANNTYAGGEGVGSWQSIAMTERLFPAGNYWNDPEIDFFIMPDYIANQYYAQISGYENVLLDYYVEAVDVFGNVKKSPIQHVFVGDGSGSSPGHVYWEPQSPQAGDLLTIFYGETGSLFNSEQLYIHQGFNDWNGTQDYEMTLQDTVWIYEMEIQENTFTIDFVFTDLQGNWDNNNGADWHIVIQSESENPFVMDGILDENAVLLAENNGINLWFQKLNGYIYVATEPAVAADDVFIFVSSELENSVNAPWAKSGTVMNWDLYLANEGTNGYANWFDAAGITDFAVNQVLEGSFELQSCLGDATDLYFAVGRYETQDGGELINQCPAGNGNIHIEAFEYVHVDLNEWVGSSVNVLASVNMFAYPNPFNPSTNIVFSLPQNMESVKVEVFNIKGQKVKTLVQADLSKGTYQFTWNGKNENQTAAASGIYFFRLSSAGEQIAIRKGMLLK